MHKMTDQFARQLINNSYKYINGKADQTLHKMTDWFKHYHIDQKGDIITQCVLIWYWKLWLEEYKEQLVVADNYDIISLCYSIEMLFV